MTGINCDRCVARATATVQKDNGAKYLRLCGHHLRIGYVKLIETGWDVQVDEGVKLYLPTEKLSPIVDVDRQPVSV